MRIIDKLPINWENIEAKHILIFTAALFSVFVIFILWVANNTNAAEVETYIVNNFEVIVVTLLFLIWLKD